MSLITAIIDHFFAKDLWIEITPEIFTFRLETSQLNLKTVIWIQKSREAILAVGEELNRAEIEQNGMTDDIQSVDLFPSSIPDPGVNRSQYLEAFFRFAFVKIHNRNVFARPKVHFTGLARLRPQIGGGFEKDLLEQAARSAGASAVVFA
jgi:hypothetical protein